MTAPFHIQLDGEEKPVFVRRHAAARRMVLKVDGADGSIKLTVPKRASLRAAQAFVESHTPWLAQQTAKYSHIRPLSAGDLIPFRGADHALVFTGIPPRRVVAADGHIHVGGPADAAPRRLLGWMKDQAKAEIAERAAAHAAALGVSFGRVSIGDMRSRWGSCSARGTLRFNWRLIMAPTAVLDYVAAHEVAHIREMNHSPQFWAGVERLVGDYAPHRAWLRKHGTRLFQVQLGEGA